MSQYIKAPQPAPGTPGPTQRGSQRAGGALASLILGILSLFCFGPLLGIPALIIGLLTVKKVNASGGQLTGKGLAIAGICLAVIGSIWGTYQGAKFVKSIKESEPGDYQQTRFQIAESNIRSKSGDKVGFGNSPKAAEMADRFGARMKLMRESFFTGESDGVLSGGEFLTHCELNQDRCAFIVHVPELRKFNDEAKESLCDLAWTIAEGTLAEAGFADGSELAVGVKGVLLYEDIMLGTFAKEGESKKRSVGNDTDLLEPFFPEPASETTDPAGETSAPATPAGESADPVNSSQPTTENQ